MQEETNEFVRVERGEYTLMLQPEMLQASDETIYFSLRDQAGFLYEYEGDLDQALDDLPEIYRVGEIGEVQAEQSLTLSPQAVVVIEQLWDYFDQTGEQDLQGEHDYNFRVEGDRLLVLPKDNSGEFTTIDRNGQVESTFELERFEHLMERFAIASQQLRLIEHQQESTKDLELG